MESESPSLMSPHDHSKSASRLAEVAKLFLRLGFTAFGGPAVHIAMMEDEVVRRRKWIDRTQFLDLLAAVNFIPGPNSTEMAIHLGLIRAGWRGLIVAGGCFIMPAMLIILPLGWLYVTWGSLPVMQGPLAGIRAAVIAIVLAALWRFIKTGVKDRFTTVLAVFAAVAGLASGSERFRVPQAELIILTSSAFLGAIWYGRGRAAKTMVKLPLVVWPGGLVASVVGLSASAKMLQLALFFLKVGATLFGSGYVLVSYLRGGLVDDHHWMTARELTDAVAIGQVTPGPLLTTATFVGYLLGYRWGGPRLALAGGVIATLAIFLPSFIFIALIGPLWNRLRSNAAARGALDGMNAAVVALIFVVSVGLARQSIHGLGGFLLAGASLLILLVWNVNSTWLVLAAGFVGWSCGFA